MAKWTLSNTLRWFGHMATMENVEFVKKMHLSSVEGPNRRGKSLGRCEERMKEYMSEMGVRGNGMN